MADRKEIRHVATLTAILLALNWASSSAVAGTYANIIVQGEAPGTEFNDWAGIPTLAMDPEDNLGGDPPFIDIKDVQIANNEDFLFLHISYHNTSSSGTLIAIDNDQNPATGFDIFALGLMGSEIGYINDFPFSQTNGIFNTNVSLTGGPLGNGGALIWPFWDQDGTDKELAIPRDLFVSFPAAPGFPNPAFNIMIYSDEGLGDITDVISYTFAEPPAGVPGDYNGNRVVDAADYTVWRNHLGEFFTLTNENPNAATPGMVDEEDYNFWKSSFGNAASPGLGAGSVSTALPEPSSAVLLASALVGWWRCKPRR